MQVRVLLRVQQTLYDGRQVHRESVLRKVRSTFPSPEELSVLSEGQGTTSVAETVEGEMGEEGVVWDRINLFCGIFR